MQHRVIAALAVVLVVGGLAVAAGSGSPPAGGVAADRQAPPRGRSSLREARGIDDFAVYFAGETIAGLPLSAVEERAGDARYVSFLYGDCRAEDHQGCALPLEIQTWPACARSLALYDAADPYAPKPERARVRGAPSGLLDEGRQLELQTRDSTVVIFGESSALVNRAAAGLRGVNNADAPGEPLRPPVAAALEGDPPCR
jgi:hypothetical protein